jgi:hypothetical protein
VHKEEDAIKMAKRQTKCRIFMCDGSYCVNGEMLIEAEEEEKDEEELEEEEKEELEGR